MNLNTASNEQLNEYREAIAKVQGIDPLMLDFIWMDDAETGLKNRVLYAKRGVAEILRQKLGIRTTSLVPYESSGWLMFTATGVDKDGRQEMAVGSAYLEGLKADKKAHAVMTAQTRAVRRLTMQFVTGGILDETEVQAQTALTGAPAASGAQLAGSPAVIPPPTVIPSAAPGKDITPSPEFDKGGPPNVHPTPLVDQKTNIAQVYEEGAKALADMKPVTERHSGAQNPPIQGVSAQEIPDIKADIPTSNTLVTSSVAPATGMNVMDTPAAIPAEEPKKKRAYKKKNQVDLSSPGQPVQTETPVSTLTVADIREAKKQLESTQILPGQNVPVFVERLPEVPPQPAIETVKVEHHVQLPPNVGTTAVGIPPLPAEKAKEFRDRLNKYSSDILPREGGMMPSEGIGGSTMKLRKFAVTHLGLEGNNANFTQEQFEDVLGFLDAFYKKNGAVALVEYINKAIGVK